MDSLLALPGDTLTPDPLLLPLGDNGGPTETHALGLGSVARDAGGNPAQLPFDQRGEGFPRSLGVAPDIDAYEAEVDLDTVFIDGFDPI